MSTGIITIADKQYMCKHDGNGRRIRYNGDWLVYSDFVGRLVVNEEWNQVAYLAQVGLDELEFKNNDLIEFTRGVFTTQRKAVN